MTVSVSGFRLAGWSLPLTVCLALCACDTRTLDADAESEPETAEGAEAIERIRLDHDQAPTIGPAGAPVTLALFLDYQCPYSAGAHPVIDRLLGKYGDRLRVVYRQNPHRSHPDASYAAQVALAAEDFGLFEPLHRRLVVDPTQLKPEYIHRHVEDLGIEAEDFEGVVQSGAFAALVEQEKALAERVGATGTPFFFVNGRPLRGLQDFEVLARVIDEELAGVSRPTRWIQRVEAPRYKVVHRDDHDHEPTAALKPLEIPASATEVERLILQELQSIRQELADLRQRVDQIHGERAAPPNPAPHRHADAPARAAPEVKSVSLDADPVLGHPDAAVAIVEFSEFQCGYCRRFHDEVFPRIQEQYIDSGKIRYVFRDYPLGFHKQAQQAAVAANCAGEQDKYWSMHDALFRAQSRLSEATFVELATGLDLDVEAFRACIRDPAQFTEVDADQRAGQGASVSGTPTFFVGRVKGNQIVDVARLVGARPYEDFARAIDAALQKAATR